jgi:predicted nuclease of predicted toxin-antitoxin system
MRVLLDECVTRLLKRDFIGHDVYTVKEAGLRGLKNSELLRSAVAQYDVLVTVDQNLAYQQNLESLGIAILILVARKNTYDALHPLMPQVLDALQGIKAGQVVTVKATPE